MYDGISLLYRHTRVSTMRASRRGHDADVILARGSQYSTQPASASQREMVEAKKIKFIKVGSKDNTADLMTKPVEVATFKQLYPKLKGIAAL